VVFGEPRKHFDQRLPLCLDISGPPKRLNIASSIHSLELCTGPHDHRNCDRRRGDDRDSELQGASCMGIGGRRLVGIGNDPRYSKSRCFDPFPSRPPLPHCAKTCAMQAKNWMRCVNAY
jgi:hypothetical protein